MRIPFNKPYMTGNELDYIAQAHAAGHLSGDGDFSRKCHGWLENQSGCNKALLTHSCTAALELSAMLANIKPGDEVIMPSYTFVSTANAFLLRGATPVFLDIRPDTLNIDESLIEAAVTDKTRAIVPVHYAGVGCEMDTILDVAAKHDLVVIEDAAQGILSEYKGRPLGSLGQLGTLSFHETKNIISGEGGALLVNDAEFAGRAEIIREKGTNRKAFFRGEVDKYTWVDVGSSFLPSDLIAAYLWAQMEQSKYITERRIQLWKSYHAAFEEFEELGLCRRPVIPGTCKHNAHMYYLLMPTNQRRAELIAYLKSRGIHAVFHYVPLHSSKMGQEYGRSCGELGNTNDLAGRLVRLPFWLGMEACQDEVIDEVCGFLET